MARASGDPVHPFLRALHSTEREAAPQEEEALWATGAQVPIGVQLQPGEGLPCEHLGEDANVAFLWVMGVHGGSGASTLTHLLRETARQGGDGLADSRIRECSLRWPSGPGTNLQATTLIVARTHGAGLAAATTAARQWAAGALPGVKLVGLALVHDAPRLSRRQQAEVERVSRLTPRCWQVPWDEAWRELVTPTLVDASRSVRRIVTSVVTQAREDHAGVTWKGKK